MGESMRRNIVGCLWIALGCLATPVWGEPVLPQPSPTPLADYYQSALQAYLSGDLDHAVLLDSKALQADPQDKKAQALLSILISDQDAARKSVIWIGGNAPETAGERSPELPAPVTVVKEVHGAARPSVDGRKLAELENRVQTVAFLLQRDSFNQYRELNNNQTQTAKELEKVSQMLKDAGIGFRYANLLFPLVLLIACLALWNSWKARRELEKQLGLREPPELENERRKAARLHRR